MFPIYLIFCFISFLLASCFSPVEDLHVQSRGGGAESSVPLHTMRVIRVNNIGSGDYLGNLFVQATNNRLRFVSLRTGSIEIAIPYQSSMGEQTRSQRLLLTPRRVTPGSLAVSPTGRSLAVGTVDGGALIITHDPNDENNPLTLSGNVSVLAGVAGEFSRVNGVVCDRTGDLFVSRNGPGNTFFLDRYAVMDSLQVNLSHGALVNPNRSWPLPAPLRNLVSDPTQDRRFYGLTLTGDAIYSFNDGLIQNFFSAQAVVFNQMAIAPNGNLVLTSNNGVYIVNPQGNIVRHIQSGLLSNSTSAVAVSSDGSYILVVSAAEREIPRLGFNLIFDGQVVHTNIPTNRITRAYSIDYNPRYTRFEVLVTENQQGAEQNARYRVSIEGPELPRAFAGETTPSGRHDRRSRYKIVARPENQSHSSILPHAPCPQRRQQQEPSHLQEWLASLGLSSVGSYPTKKIFLLGYCSASQ